MRAGASLCHQAETSSCFLKPYPFAKRDSGYSDRVPNGSLHKQSVLRLGLRIWLRFYECRNHACAPAALCAGGELEILFWRSMTQASNAKHLFAFTYSECENVLIARRNLTPSPFPSSLRKVMPAASNTRCSEATVVAEPELWPVSKRLTVLGVISALAASSRTLQRRAARAIPPDVSPAPAHNLRASADIDLCRAVFHNLGEENEYLSERMEQIHQITFQHTCDGATAWLVPQLWHRLKHDNALTFGCRQLRRCWCLPISD
jgi:hypothetical protein